MNEYLQVLLNLLERGIIFGLVVASVHISSMLIGFDNLSIEGAFGLGSALTAFLISFGVPPLAATVLATCAGGLSGIATGLLNRKLKLNPLVSGIVVTTGLFSLSLITAGSTMALGGRRTILHIFESICAPYHMLVMLALLTTGIFLFIRWFLKTEVGFLLQAVGCTPQMLINIGKDADSYYIMGLTLSNMLAALSGSLFVQYTGYFSIWTGIGILIIGLTGMILAQTINSRFGIALIIGSVLYQLIITTTFELNISQDLNKLITALLIVGLIVFKQEMGNKKGTSC